MGPELESFISHNEQLFDQNFPSLPLSNYHHASNLELQPIFSNQKNKAIIGSSASSSLVNYIPSYASIGTKLVTEPMDTNFNMKLGSSSSGTKRVTLTPEEKLTGLEIQPFEPVLREIKNNPSPIQNGDAGLMLVPQNPDQLLTYIRNEGVPKMYAMLKKIIEVVLKDLNDKAAPLPKPVEAFPGSGVLLIGPPKRYRTRTALVGELKFSFILPKQFDIFANNIDELLVKEYHQAPNGKQPSEFTFTERLRGWTIEHRRRVDGRDDKYYYHNNMLFRSRVEVLRFVIYNVYPLTPLEKRRNEEDPMAFRSRIRRGPYKKRRTSSIFGAQGEKEKEPTTLEKERMVPQPINSFRFPESETDDDSEETESDDEEINFYF